MKTGPGAEGGPPWVRLPPAPGQWGTRGQGVLPSSGPLFPWGGVGGGVRPLSPTGGRRRLAVLGVGGTWDRRPPQ